MKGEGCDNVIFLGGEELGRAWAIRSREELVSREQGTDAEDGIMD
jgi:hypothetical protein